MRGLEEAFGGLAADALGGRVGGDVAGMLGLERLEAVHQGIVLGVGEDGGVEDVVEVLVVADLVAEGLNLLKIWGSAEIGSDGIEADYKSAAQGSPDSGFGWGRWEPTQGDLCGLHDGDFVAEGSWK